MSMSTVNRQIDRLLHEAVSESDPDKLLEIARILTRLGAWEDAALVTKRAKQIERRLAEVNG
jgi:hypothetical protein